MNRLKELREEAILTVHELAERSGVSEDTITKIENGHRAARPSTIRKLAAALDVDPRELRRTEEPALAGKAKAPSSGPVNAAEQAKQLDATRQLTKLLHEARALRAADEHIESAAAALDRLLSERIPTAAEGLAPTAKEGLAPTAKEGLAPTAEEGLFDLIEAVLEENEHLKTRISELEAA